MEILSRVPFQSKETPKHSFTTLDEREGRKTESRKALYIGKSEAPVKGNRRLWRVLIPPLCLPVSLRVRGTGVSVSGIGESAPFKICHSHDCPAFPLHERLNDPGQLASFLPVQAC